MNKKHILVIEDEEDIQDLLRMNLSSAGFSTSFASDGIEGLEQCRKNPPDLVLIDWMLPRLAGIEVLAALKKEKNTAALPAIMLTAKSETENITRALDAGADDYITKPFVNKELIARINAVLRRAPDFSQDTGKTLTINKLSINADTHRLYLGNNAIDISPTEFRLLYFFMSNPEKVFSRENLLDRVWGTNVYIDERTVDVHIRRLRKILSRHALDHLIETVHGIGYRFSPETH
ncbi:MAG: response regulator [Pseudomonadales bacterium]|nr:response regulator [Pseudomonadales bacterium]